MAQELSHATISLPAEGEQSLCQEREETGFIAVAKHVYGCRVVQRIMESCCLPGWKAKICREVRAAGPYQCAGTISVHMMDLLIAQALETYSSSASGFAGRGQHKPCAGQRRKHTSHEGVCAAAEWAQR